MYHIFAPQRHRQDGAFLGKNQALAARRRRPARPGRACGGRPRRRRRHGSADGPCPARAAGSTRSAPLIRVPPRASRPKPVERGLAQRGFDPLAEIGGDVDVAGLEGAGERALELALGIGFVERVAADADPGAAARRPGADVGRDLAVGRPSASRISSSRGAVRRVRMQVRSGTCASSGSLLDRSASAASSRHWPARRSVCRPRPRTSGRGRP